MNRFEVFRLDHVGTHARLISQRERYVAHQVLDELRVVVRSLGHVLFVSALQQAVYLTGGGALGDSDEFFDRQGRYR